MKPKNWIWVGLALILFLSFFVRLSTISESGWLLAYDPYMHYRFTEYVVEDGVLPVWDEFSYYPGRPMSNYPPLMYYLTGYLYLIFNPLFGLPLMTFCGYMAAVFGAIAIIPAYLLGKEFSGKIAGILSAFFVGFSPAIMSRTVGGFFDTDGLVIFFSLLTMYLLVRTLKKEPNIKKKIINYSLATVGLVLFGLTWVAAWYIPLIVFGSLGILFLIKTIENKFEYKEPLKDILLSSLPLFGIFCLASIVVFLLGTNSLQKIIYLFTFAKDPSSMLIVNVSVAELQKLNIFGANGWIELFARVGAPFIFFIPGALLLLKRDRKNGAILLGWAGISFYAITRGIRFMLLFAPAACIAAAVCFGESFKHIKKMGQYAPLICFGYFISIAISFSNPMASIFLNIVLTVILIFSDKLKIKESELDLSKPILVGAVIVLLLFTFSQGYQTAVTRGGEPVNANWEEAYMFLKSETAEDAVVGSWWDPGHRIAGIAERRNIADGAHCDDKSCSPGLNTRITDLGKIFYTDNETVAKDILLKYKGDASEIYWIVSDDLIGKFRWLQYFGTGCDGTGEYTYEGWKTCPLYSILGQQTFGYDAEYNIMQYVYANGLELIKREGEWFVTVPQSDKRLLFTREIIVDEENNPRFLYFDYLPENETLPGTVWVQPNKNYIVYIPQPLEESLFTQMFFYERNETLENFEMVFKNKQVKIYKLV